MKKMDKRLRRLIVVLSVILAVAAIVGALVAIDSIITSGKAKDISVEEAQTLVDTTLDDLPVNIAKSAIEIRKNTVVTVKSVESRKNKELVFHCTYTTLDVKTSINEEAINEIVASAADAFSAVMGQIQAENTLNKYIASAERTPEREIDIYAYETRNEGIKLHLSDETVNTVFGGILDVQDRINGTMSYVDSDGKTHDISRDNALRDGCVGGISLKNYSSERPDTSTAIRRTWNNFKDEFHRNFIKDGRWKYLAKGLGTTLAITALALVLGIVIGVVIAVVRCTYAKTGKLIVLDKICKVYLSIIRGTPVMIQLMIIYFVLLLPVGIEKFPAAVICFGVNSGAYVSEIIRGGIMAVDDGQSEAGRSLGLGYVATMWHIVVPQAFKAILPSLANEFITLLKETSVAFYIGVADLTQGGLKIRSLTYSNFMPLIAVALIYLVLVLALSYLVSLLERRLRKSDRR